MPVSRAFAALDYAAALLMEAAGQFRAAIVTNSQQPTVVPVGDNMTPIWGMGVRERTRRIAAKAGLPFVETVPAGRGPLLLVNTAFAFDPPLLRHMAGQGATVLTKDGVPAIARLADPVAAGVVMAAMLAGRPVDAEPTDPDTALRLSLSKPGGSTLRQAQGERILSEQAASDAPSLVNVAHDPGFTLYNEQLRKREQPFLMPLTPATVGAIERASYLAAYKGVTDILTKYLWPEWALVLTRIAARIGMTPNIVTGIGAALCVWAFFLFWGGHYWAGMAAGLIFMVLDTVDGKLARCTITSSWWGQHLRSWHRSGASALLVVGVGRGTGDMGAGL